MKMWWRKSDYFKATLFAIWLVLVSVALASLMAGHTVAFLPPSPRQLAQLPGAQGARAWRLVHIFAPDCLCSRTVSDRLLERGTLPGSEELVILAGPDATLAARLRERGFHVQDLRTAELKEKYGIEGVPWLVIFSPAGEALYSGGYNDHPISKHTRIRDLELFAQAKNGQAPAPLPAYGCATSERLKRLLDPLHLKY